MEAFGALSVSRTALPGQDNLTGSLWSNTAALDSNADLTDVLSTIQSTANRGAFKVELEKLTNFDVKAGLNSSDPSSEDYLHSQTLEMSKHGNTTGEIFEAVFDAPSLNRQSTVQTTAVGDNNREVMPKEGPAQDSLTGITEGAALVGGVSRATNISATPTKDITDFNQDGQSDILWRNSETGKNVVWLMQGTKVTDSAALASVSSPKWQMSGTGHFNQDGQSDILWRNSETGKNVVWLMQGTKVTDSAALASVSSPKWQMSGTGHFNQDGQSDILWRNSETGKNVVWLMQGTKVTDSAALASVSSPKWQMSGTGHFNQDGQSDILWRNSETGKNVVWLMQGTKVTDSAALASVSSPKWQMSGTGHFNQDGQSDILWRNSETGKNVVWLMQGTKVTDSAALASVSSPQWQMSGTSQVANLSSNFTQINWSTAAPSLVPRGEAVGGVVNGKLYLLGGYLSNPFRVLDTIDVYNPTNNTWTRVAKPMPKPLSHTGTEIQGDNIYLAGGYVGTGGSGQIFATKDVWKYNVVTNKWTALTPLPQARGGGALELLNGKLHFFGGSDLKRQDTATHWALDLSNPSSNWVQKAPLPNARNHLGDSTLGGRIYAIGGQKGQDAKSVTQTSVHRYNPVTNKWQEVEPLPQARSHIAAGTFVMDGRIIVSGGEARHGGSNLADVTAYDPVSNSWMELTPLPAARKSGVAGSIGDQIFFATGYNSTTYKGVPKLMS